MKLWDFKKIHAKGWKIGSDHVLEIQLDCWPGAPLFDFKVVHTTKKHDQAVRELRQKGESYQGIQRRLGVSKGAVCRALAGMPKKRLRKMPQDARSPGG